VKWLVNEGVDSSMYRFMVKVVTLYVVAIDLDQSEPLLAQNEPKT
jgi:hypothetical protein